MTLPAARVSIALIFLWFGLVKLIGVSPATPLARELTARTVGAEHFGVLFSSLALLECVIGILFLIPKLTRVATVMLLFHMVIVSSPLLLVPNLTWHGFLVPTLEGQYVIKNAVVVAAAMTIAGASKPLQRAVPREEVLVREPEPRVVWDLRDHALVQWSLAEDQRPDYLARLEPET
jgi:uncharacterized membrane protein YkgB